MDRELEGKSKSREWDTILGDGDVLGQSGENKEVAENAHILGNLLKSLEASAGEAGPVPNMLKEMGSSLPKGI